MKKQIRLLIENLFDDDFNNIYNDTNLDSEISDEYMGYKVGDIIYKNKKPYAVCCGEKQYFTDNKPRFMSFQIYMADYLKWSNINTVIPKLKIYNDFDKFNILNKSSIKHIDEDGYENTQIIKNNYNLSYFPAFKYCLSFGDNVYLPAIDELQILFINRQKLNNIDKKNYHAVGFWSSSQRSVNKAIAFTFSWGNSCCIFSDDKTSFSHTVFPFVKINN